MASDNMAVDVQDVDVMSLHEMEAGLGSSRTHLIQQMEEEKPPSIRQSIQKSLTKSVRKAKFYLSILLAPFKYIIMKFKLLILIALYSCFGAWLFRALEVPHDLATKEEAYHARLIARDVMILNLRAIHLENKEDRENRWKDAVMQFEADVGLEEPSVETAWTFWMAFLYAGTLYTTIGYGNIACQTRGGQVATLIYSFVGIPITLVLLNGLGDFLLKLTKVSAGLTSDIFLFAGVRWGFIPLEEGSDKRKRYQHFCYKLSKAKLLPAPSHFSLVREEKEEVEHEPPVLSAIILTIIVMITSSTLFSLLEGWDFFTSWYFFFISCSTIGLGDVVPSKPEFMIIALGVMFVGLAMITVCFNVIQEKMERLYMAMLRKLLEDYIKAVENNDPNATAGMMKGFQGKAKFLMPLMSKNTGAAAMEKFKKKCAEEGIEPPPVLTNINPDTGMPAFATANKEDFSDFIEQAEEKQAEERRLNEERVQSRQSNQPEMRVQAIDVYVQAESAPVYAPRLEGTNIETQTTSAPDRSFGAQFSPMSNDAEIQTIEATNIDEGIQTWPFCEEVSVQYDAIRYATVSSQYDMPELTTSTAVGAEERIFTCTAIQPEVSMFAVSDDSEEETTDFDISDEDIEELEENLNNLTLPTIQRLRKSVSEESQDTVVSVSPSMSPTSKRKKLDEKKKKKSMRVEGLRFMKHSSDQTSFEVFTVDTQTDYTSTVIAIQCQAETSEQSLQHSISSKGRRCQTKITCIPMEKRNMGYARQTSIGKSKKILPSQPSNATTTSSQIHSAGSIEGLAKHPSLQSISESENIRSDSDGNEVANLNVSDGAKPNEEEGLIVGQYYVDERSIAESEMTGADVGDDIFDSEDDLLDEEMEEFVYNECTQTEGLILFDDLEVQVSVLDFDILREVLCQTELSSFRISQKDLKSIEERRKSEEQKQKEDIPESVVLGDTPKFLTESCVQTAQTMVYVGEKNEEDTDELINEEIGVQYLVDSGCNPDLETSTVECQTEVPQTSTTISTTPEKVHISVQHDYVFIDVDTQVELITEEQEIQATTEMQEADSQVIIELQEEYIQVEDSLWKREDQTSVQTITECVDTATGAHIETLEAECSTAIETVEVETNTLIEMTEAEAQTLIPHSCTGIQPINEFSRPHAAQTVIETSEGETQFEINLIEVETQTDLKKVKRKETSVSTAPDTKSAAAAAVKEHIPAEVDATRPMISRQAQSDVSMFVVDPSDRSRMEVEHDVRFNIDSGTWMEEKRLKHIGTQKESDTHSSFVQVRPSLVTSHTQYVFSCASDQHSQTEILMKNKRSQEVETSALVTESGMETEDLHLLEGVALWSDFDPIFEETDNQFVENSGESQNPYARVTNHGVETTEEVIDGERKKIVKRVSRRRVTKEEPAALVLEDNEAQATVETEEKSCGQEGADDWVKVYVQELDEERRLRMFDIGIQTGVLARVQHMYGKKDVSGEEGGSNVDILKVSLRKTESTEQLSKAKKYEGSEENLSHASSVRSIAESVDDNPTTWPSSSKPKTEVRRSTSMKKPAKKREQKGNVEEAIRQFERRNNPEQRRARSSSSER